MAKGDFLGEFEVYVMLALAHQGADAYGVTIRREIEARTGRTVAIGRCTPPWRGWKRKDLCRTACPIRSQCRVDAPENTLR